MTNSGPMTLKQVEAKAKKALKKGNTALAAELFTAILKQYPGHKFAKKSLKKLQKENPDAAVQTRDDLNELIRLYESGQMDAAVNKGKELLKSRPDLLAVRNIVGAALIGTGRPDKAVQVFDDIIAKHPENSEAYNNRGIACRELGDLESARENYTRAIELRPDYAEAYSNRGVVNNELGDLEAAVEDYDRAIELKPDYANAYSNRGTALSRLNMLEAALESFERAIELAPSHAEAYFNLGFAYKTSDLLEEAVENYEQAVKLRPDYPEAWHNWGVALHDMGQIEKALDKFEKAVEIRPDYPEAYMNYGRVLVDMGLRDAGIAVYDRALSAVTAKDNHPKIYYCRSVALNLAGRPEDALDSCTRALELQPNYPEAVRLLATLRRFTQEDAWIPSVHNLLKAPDNGDTEKMHLNFALSSMYEDTGDVDRSWDHLETGKAIQKEEMPYDIGEALDGLRLIRDGFRQPEAPLKTEETLPYRPVFIVGMPCAGSGLVGDILGTHSQVWAAGPMESMNKLLSLMPAELLQTDDEWYSEADLWEEITILRDRYKTNLDMFGTDLPVIVDSNPMNFRWIGFILTAFPDAAVIHLTRDPMATCGSIFRESSNQVSLGFACDQGWIADYYRAYQDLMAFWHAQFPAKITDVNYERLVASPEAEIRNVLAACGLAFEDVCLGAHQHAFSRLSQGRRDPGAWRKFDPWLSRLKEGLAG